MIEKNPCTLIISDGIIYHGEGFGFEQETSGEIGEIELLIELRICYLCNRFTLLSPRV